jgi:arylsulfatase A-like enzyme
MSRHKVVLPLFAALALGSTGCGTKPVPDHKGRGVLVIAIDALRADHVSCLGYDRPTTPVLDGLASQGVVFSNAFSSSPELLPAHAALLTGCDPTLAQRPAIAPEEDQPLLARWYVPDRLPRLAQEFLAQGFLTAAFVDQPTISPVFGLGGGFQHFAVFNPEDAPPRTEMGVDGVSHRLLNWVNEIPADRDWFAYVHLHDLVRSWIPDDRVPPDPKWDTYFEPRDELSGVPPVAEADRIFFALPRTRWDGGTMSLGEYEARYDGALCQLDTKLRWIFEALRRRGRFGSTTVVVTGTFGIGFGESGLILDSGTLSDVDLHVPLIVRPAPEVLAVKPRTTDALASLTDVAPTLLELSGIPLPRGMQGVSLLRVLTDEQASAREFAYASGGLQDGWVVFDKRYCFEHSSFGPRSKGIAASWFGDGLPHVGVTRSFLHDREHGGKGHVSAPDEDPEVARRLEARGEEWFEWAGRARDLLQGSLSGEAGSVTSELRRRGWIE